MNVLSTKGGLGLGIYKTFVLMKQIIIIKMINDDYASFNLHSRQFRSHRNQEMILIGYTLLL